VSGRQNASTKLEAKLSLRLVSSRHMVESPSIHRADDVHHSNPIHRLRHLVTEQQSVEAARAHPDLA
jgi:hypothetical protein